MLYWFIFGAFLILLELFTPTFIFLFFGIGAWAAAVVAAIFPGTTQEIIVFILVTVISLLFFRSKMQRTFMGRKSNAKDESNDVDEDFIYRNMQATVEREISPKLEGEIHLAGSYWRATADTVIPAGAIVIVEKASQNDKLLLIVREQR